LDTSTDNPEGVSRTASPDQPQSPPTPGQTPSEGIRADNRAQGTNLVGLIIGVVIAAIVGIAVGIPVINDVIAQANISGTTALIVGFIPVMIGLMIFVATASPIMRRV